MDTQAWLDQHDAHIATTIRRHGWYIAYIGGGSRLGPDCDRGDSDHPSFAYTVGMFGLAHPELLIFGVGPETAANILNGLGSQILAGEAILPGHVFRFEEWLHRIIPEPVPNPGEIVFVANRFYRRPGEYSVPVLQLSYDDTEGRFRGRRVTPHRSCNRDRGRSGLAETDGPRSENALTRTIVCDAGLS